MMRQKVSTAGGEAPTVRESCERIGAELSNVLRAFAPSEEVLAHFRAARIEVLKGLRAASMRGSSGPHRTGSRASQ